MIKYFVAAFFLVLIYSIPAMACIGAGIPRNAYCQPEAGNSILNVNETYFKIPNHLVPEKKGKQINIRDNHPRVFPKGSVTLHAYADTLAPVCGTRHPDGALLQDQNLLSYYHFPIIATHSCDMRAKAKEYNADFIKNLLWIKLYQKHPEFRKPRNEYIARLKNKLTVPNDSEALALDMPGYKGVRHRSLRPDQGPASTDLISWSPSEKILLLRNEDQNPDTAPDYLECYIKPHTPKIPAEPGTLGAYEFCDLSFLYKDKIYVRARVNGNQIPYDGTEVETATLQSKITDFIEGFEIPNDDTEFQNLLAEKTAVIDRQILDGQVDQPFVAAINLNRIDLLQKLLEQNQEPENKAFIISYLMSKPFSDQRTTAYLTLLKNHGWTFFDDETNCQSSDCRAVPSWVCSSIKSDDTQTIAFFKEQDFEITEETCPDKYINTIIFWNE